MDRLIRARRALDKLASIAGSFHLVTCPGEMGAAGVVQKLYCSLRSCSF